MNHFRHIALLGPLAVVLWSSGCTQSPSPTAIDEIPTRDKKIALSLQYQGFSDSLASIIVENEGRQQQVHLHFDERGLLEFITTVSQREGIRTENRFLTTGMMSETWNGVRSDRVGQHIYYQPNGAIDSHGWSDDRLVHFGLWQHYNREGAIVRTDTGSVVNVDSLGRRIFQ